MPDFWPSCGYRLLARGGDGRLTVTDDYLRSFLARPELAPIPESCAAELALHDALQAVAGRGLRKLLSFGEGAGRQLAALVPVDTGVAALMLGKDRVCEELSIQAFARTFSLTAAETRVLVALGGGARPTEIARDQGVKLSTVRTQIGAIREKTGAEGITALVRLVAALPPMVGALRA